MIDVSLCPNPWVKKTEARLYKVVTAWLNTLPAVPGSQDASGGKLKAALTSSTPLFVTSYQYLIGNDAFTCLNVMVDRQDYRLIIGYDDQIIRVETLDARSARAQTRSEADYWAKNGEAGAGVVAPADNGNAAAPYANNPNPYGVRIQAPDSPYANNPNPYGTRIPAQ